MIDYTYKEMIQQKWIWENSVTVAYWQKRNMINGFLTCTWQFYVFYYNIPIFIFYNFKYNRDSILNYYYWLDKCVLLKTQGTFWKSPFFKIYFQRE